MSEALVSPLAEVCWVLPVGGMLKLSYTTAFTVSMLSWAYYEFKGGYVASGNLEFGANTIRWGADYLMKVAVTNASTTTTVAPIFVAQVGDGGWGGLSAGSIVLQGTGDRGHIPD